MIENIDLKSIKRESFDQELNKLTGYIPNNWQKIVREEESRFKVICVGRRGGKSHYVCHDTIDGLVADLVLPNQKVWIVAPNYDLTQRVWDEIYNLSVSKFRDIISSIHNTKGNYLIKTVFDTIIEAKSGEEPEKLVGVGLTKIIVDEAALLKEKAWTQSLRPTLMDHHGKAIFISTPKGKNWFWELWMKGQNKEELDWKSWRFTSYENEHIDKKELDAITRDMPEFEYRQEILATFEETSEQIFRNSKECIKGVFKDKEIRAPEKGHRYQIGVDLGRKTSYTVITVIDEMVFPYPVVYWDRFQTANWSLQKLRIKEVWNKYPCLRLRVDATGIGDPMEEDLQNMGVRTEPFMFKEMSKRQLIDKLTIMIEGKQITYPNIKILLAEMETFGREVSPSGHIKYRAMGKNFDDCVNSLGLATWGLLDAPRKVRMEKEDKPKLKPISKITGY